MMIFNEIVPPLLSLFIHFREEGSVCRDNMHTLEPSRELERNWTRIFNKKIEREDNFNSVSKLN